jgi:FMN phosphatase YigB (HAD superfamily)
MCAERLGVDVARVLAVGDRLDTDIEGAVAAGADSLLVLTGVDDLQAVLTAPESRRPTWVAPDLRGLLEDPDDRAGVLAGLTAAVHAVHAAHDAGATTDEVDGLIARAEGVLHAGLHR